MHMIRLNELSSVSNDRVVDFGRNLDFLGGDVSHFTLDLLNLAYSFVYILLLSSKDHVAVRPTIRQVNFRRGSSLQLVVVSCYQFNSEKENLMNLQ